MVDLQCKAREASALGDFKLAANLWQEAIDAGPATAELHVDRALALTRSNLLIDATKELDIGLKLDSSISRAYLIKGALLMQMKNYQSAVSVLSLGHSYAPENSKFAFLLSKCKKHIDEDSEDSEETDTEETDNEKSEKMHKDSEDSEETDTEDSEETDNEKSEKMHKDIEDSEETDIEDSEETNNEKSEKMDSEEFDEINEARQAFDKGDFKLALDLCTQGIESSPATTKSYNERALVLFRLGRHTDALEDLKTALELDPSLSCSYLIKGIILMKMEDYQGAKAAFSLGRSYAPRNSEFVFQLNRCEKYIDEHTRLAESEETNEVRDAFNKGDFKLALDLCTQAIDSSPATAELHTNRALILIKLGRNIDAIEELNTALKLDPNMSRTYIMKGDLLMKMQDYHGAMAVLRLGCSYAPNNSTIALFLSKCSASGLCPSKPRYRHGFYNNKDRVVLSIHAKGISAGNVSVQFSEEKLNVSIMAPDEEPFHFQCVLFAKIIPKKCKYRVLAKEIEITLAKSEHQTWPVLSKSSTMISDDYEFSWAKRSLNNKKIVPGVQDQGNKGTCVFQAITSATRMEMNRLAALKDPPESSQIKFSTNDFVSEFEKAGETIRRLKQQQQQQQQQLSLKNGLKVFKERGVLIHGGRKYRIKGYQKISLCFREMRRLLKLGRPIAGGFYVDRTFDDLGPNDIYDYDHLEALKKNDEMNGHAIVFVGYGWRDARAYLVFLNSHGTSFGDEGFGRVYFDRVSDLHTIDV